MRASAPVHVAARLLTTVGMAALLAACGGGEAGREPEGDAVRVVTTTTVLADMARNVAGRRAMVEALIPPGVEVHTFDPSPASARALAQADVVFANGLGLDEWIEGLAADVAGPSVAVVDVAAGLPGVRYIDADDEAHGSEEPHEGESGIDPHVWLDATNAARYAERIAEELGRADPDGAAVYAENADAYVERLRALDSEVRALLEAIPQEQRRVVSFHDGFRYFAAAYGLEIAGVVVEVPGQDPSAGEVAALIDAIRSERVRAVLAEAAFPADLARTIAAEAGATVVADLYTDSLGEPPRDSYEAILRWDAERIAAALR